MKSIAFVGLIAVGYLAAVVHDLLRINARGDRV